MELSKHVAEEISNGFWDGLSEVMAPEHGLVQDETPNGAEEGNTFLIDGESGDR